MANPGTRFNKIVSIGSPLATFAALATTVMLYVHGGIQVKDQINFTPNGVTSGAVLQVNGLTRIHAYPINCTATGGVATGVGYYDTCIGRSPYANSGAIIGYSLECGSTQLAFSASGGLVQGTNKVVSAARGFRNLGNHTVGTGGAVTSFTGTTLYVRASDNIKIGTHTTIPNTITAPDCKAWIYGFDLYGS